MIDSLNSQIYSQSLNATTVNPQIATGAAKIDISPQTNSVNESVRLSLSPAAQKLLKNQATATSDKAGNDNPSPTNPKQKNNGPPNQLSQQQKDIVQKLQTRDSHVRAHEAAHMAVAGAYARGGVSFDFETGPDGKAYAVGGEIQLDTSPVPNDPQATIAKAEIIKAGALAPSDPSAADISVAAGASQMETEARAELAQKNQNTTATGSNTKTNSQDQARCSRNFKPIKTFLHPNQIGQIINQSA